MHKTVFFASELAGSVEWTISTLQGFAIGPVRFPRPGLWL